MPDQATTAATSPRRRSRAAAARRKAEVAAAGRIPARIPDRYAASYAAYVAHSPVAAEPPYWPAFAAAVDASRDGSDGLVVQHLRLVAWLRANTPPGDTTDASIADAAAVVDVVLHLLEQRTTYYQLDAAALASSPDLLNAVSAAVSACLTYREKE